MKLVKLLAKELKEWPEGVGKVMQDFDMEIRFFDLSGDQMTLLDFYIDELASDACDEIIFSGGGVEITKSQWQAEREKMNKPKWIRHRGGKCPVPCGTRVETQHRNGYTCTPHFYTQNASSDVGMNLVWGHKGDMMDIMAYRVIEETKDQEIEEVKVADVKLEMMQGDSWVTIDRVSPDFVASVFVVDPPSKGEEVKDTNIGTLTYKLEVDTSSAMTALNELSAKWDQIESPLKWRDAIIHCQAIIEDCEREIQRNVNLLDAEGLMMQKDSKKAMQYYQTDIDMSDWRNWQIGDRVCATKNFDDADIGDELIITRLDHADEEQPIGMSTGSSATYWPEMNWVKFVSRP